MRPAWSRPNFEPKPPPITGTRLRTALSGNPSTSAASPGIAKVAWVEAWTVASSPPR